MQGLQKIVNREEVASIHSSLGALASLPQFTIGGSEAALTDFMTLSQSDISLPPVAATSGSEPSRLEKRPAETEALLTLFPDEQEIERLRKRREEIRNAPSPFQNMLHWLVNALERVFKAH